MLNTRVSVRTSCLRNFGQNDPEINKKKKISGHLLQFLNKNILCL